MDEQTMKQLEIEFGSGEELDISDPDTYRQICREYSEIITPGLDAIDRALRLSRVTINLWP